jgi:hypothetical protein
MLLNRTGNRGYDCLVFLVVSFDRRVPRAASTGAKSATPGLEVDLLVLERGKQQCGQQNYRHYPERWLGQFLPIEIKLLDSPKFVHSEREGDGQEYQDQAIGSKFV